MDGDGLILLAVKWQASDGFDGEEVLRPHVRLRRASERVSHLEPLAGLRLNYRASSQKTERVCLGHVPFRKRDGPFHDCANPVEPGSRRCQRCAIIEATFASNLHHAHTRSRGELDPAILDHLGQPNVLYLAGFRDGSVKVGTSTAVRLEQRLTEQGAWAAQIVATADDGFAVRDLEDRVSDSVGLPQSVSASRKIAGLLNPTDDATLVAQLQRHGGAVEALIASMCDARIALLDERWRNPARYDDTTTSTLYPYPLALRNGSHDLELVTAIGRVAIGRLWGSQDHFVFDLGELFGLELETGDFVSDEIAIQDSLF